MIGSSLKPDISSSLARSSCLHAETAKPAAPYQNEEKAATEAEDLLAEAKALSEKEAQVSGQEKAQVCTTTISAELQSTRNCSR